MAKAQVGDLIRVVNADLHVGEIFEVIDVDDKIAYVDCEDYSGFAHRNYVIHRKAGEEDSETDAVNSPNHYTQGKFETIEVIEELTQNYSDGYVAYCVGNTLKYLARAPFKHETPIEDLRKAAKYIEFAIERLTQNERTTK